MFLWSADLVSTRDSESRNYEVMLIGEGFELLVAELGRLK